MQDNAIIQQVLDDFMKGNILSQNDKLTIGPFTGSRLDKVHPREIYLLNQFIDFRNRHNRNFFDNNDIDEIRDGFLTNTHSDTLERIFSLENKKYSLLIGAIRLSFNLAEKTAVIKAFHVHPHPNYKDYDAILLQAAMLICFLHGSQKVALIPGKKICDLYVKHGFGLYRNVIVSIKNELYKLTQTNNFPDIVNDLIHFLGLLDKPQLQLCAYSFLDNIDVINETFSNYHHPEIYSLLILECFRDEQKNITRLKEQISQYSPSFNFEGYWNDYIVAKKQDLSQINEINNNNKVKDGSNKRERDNSDNVIFDDEPPQKRTEIEEYINFPIDNIIDLDNPNLFFNSSNPHLEQRQSRINFNISSPDLDAPFDTNYSFTFNG